MAIWSTKENVRANCLRNLTVKESIGANCSRNLMNKEHGVLKSLTLSEGINILKCLINFCLNKNRSVECLPKFEQFMTKVSNIFRSQNNL